MSRAFEINVRAKGLKTIQDAKKVQSIINELWVNDYGSILNVSEQEGWESYGGGTHYLGGGKSDDEFAYELAVNLWRKIGYHFDINISSVYLEDLPFEEFIFTENDYEQWKKEESDE
jgi:predicted butyrate kinase (DUF1464 family)